MKHSFRAVSLPECNKFLLIRAADEPFQLIEDFVSLHPNISEELLATCTIRYRGKDISYSDYDEQYKRWTESLNFVCFQKPVVMVNPSIEASAYFVEKAIECLQFARFFIIKSGRLLENDYHIPWTQGYQPQFLFRCIYFGTATTWLQNSFDQVLQAVYWAKELYKCAKDKQKKAYDTTWDVKKVLQFCNYTFVKRELDQCSLTDCSKHLSTCYAKTKTVRDWANFIKHKGGIDYKYLEAESPLKKYFVPVEAQKEMGRDMNSSIWFPDPRFEIKDFRSPIKVDIDKQLATLVNAHSALYQVICETIADIDFANNSLIINNRLINEDCDLP